MREKIIHFMDYKAPYKGNFINSIMFLDNELRKIDKEIVYIFPKETEKMEWINELRLKENKVYFLSGEFYKDINLVKNIIKNDNIKIIHLHFVNYLYILLFKLSGINKGIKLITHLHNHYKVKNNIFFEKIMRFIKKTDLYIGVSNSVAQDLIQKGFDKDKVIAIPNAIEFDRLNTYESISKEDLGITTKNTILMFGFDYYRKGVDRVVKAIKEIEKTYDLTLLISLSTNKENVESKIIEELGFFPTWIKILEARDDIATYYNLADVFISASREEGFCYAAVEAAYCDSLLIASDIPGQNSLNIPHTISFSVNSGEELRKSIIETFSLSSEEILKIKKNQRQYVLDEYNLKKWSKSIINLY